MLVWEHGAKGGNRGVQPAATRGPRSSLAGFLNLVHPNDIQIFGSEEIAYLDALDSRKRWETIAEIVGNKPVALVIADSLATPDDLAESAEEVDLPIWTSIRPGVDLANRLQHFLSRPMAESKTVHGVFMEVFSIGVLITGDSGSGALLGSFKGESIGGGLGFSWIPKSAGGKFSVSASWVRDIYTRKRLDADYVSLTLALTF